MMTGTGTARDARRKAYRVVVHGEVTGVGFRYSAVREAQGHNDLRGYVRNTDARTVECILEGPEPDVCEFIEWLRHGPPGARVKSADVSPLTISRDLPPFQVKY